MPLLLTERCRGNVFKVGAARTEMEKLINRVNNPLARVFVEGVVIVAALEN